MATNMLLIILLLLVSLHNVHADFVEHTLVVHNTMVSRMCKKQEITVVNASFPGPTINVHEGDSVAIHVINKSPYDMSIHWHGVFQLLSSWHDGPGYISQCPIRPGNKFTYRFNITNQEGTLFWHAHTGWLRATVHGALVIRPKKGNSYPFPKPSGEFPIVIGEWFNSSIVDLEKELLFYGNGPNYSQGLTINGWLGDFYPCSSSRRRFLPEDQPFTIELPIDAEGLVLDDIYKVKVERGKTYMLRIVCASMNNHAFFKVAEHTMTVVAIDAVYTTPYITDIIVLSPGQTVDILITTDQKPASYYMASRYYNPLVRVDGTPPNNTRNPTPQTGLIIYEEASTSSLSSPILPKNLPELSDVGTAFKFLSSLKSLQNGPHWSPVPLQVDEHMFVTHGLGVGDCLREDKYLCQGPNFTFMAASLNNQSFVLPKSTSLLEAYYNNVSGVYTTDFPDEPPKIFDFTNTELAFDSTLLWAEKGTKVKKLKYNSTVEIVFQNTALLSPESHPIHLHGFNFYVLAQGYGNYQKLNDEKKFNLVNPQMRNTLAVPLGGWAAIRFRANNPGVWYMHCHLEFHVPFGLATAFIVEDGPTPQTTLPPPPVDFPRCEASNNKYFV